MCCRQSMKMSGLLTRREIISGQWERSACFGTEVQGCHKAMEDYDGRQSAVCDTWGRRIRQMFIMQCR